MLESEFVGEELALGGCRGCVAGRWAACVCSCSRRETSAPWLAMIECGLRASRGLWGSAGGEGWASQDEVEGVSKE
jgi:hypothetical protein